jgi:hypothetical protein
MKADIARSHEESDDNGEGEHLEVAEVRRSLSLWILRSHAIAGASPKLLESSLKK